LAFGVGPVTAKEWLWQAGLPATMKVEDLDEADLASLKEVMSTAVADFRSHHFIPTVCTDGQNRLKSISAFPPVKPLAEGTCRQFPSMSEAVEYTHKLRPVHIAPEKDLLVKQMTSELHKLERKAEKLAQELTESLSANKLKQQGDVLMANLTNIPIHSASVTLTDFYGTDSDSQITIALDPAKSAADNAQKYYGAYHKQKRAQALLAEQITTCQNEHAYLETILVSLDHSSRNSDIEEIRQELITAKYVKASKRRQALPPAKPLSTHCDDGSRIIIGKNNKQNDEVTFKIARSDDLWFHTKDIPGSHVILQSSGLPEIEHIELAAGLAAYFSKSRHSSKVPVDYTKRRYVKKPSGANPGFVIYEKQTTLYVSPAREYGEKLLQDK
jgi:predicted ribosome quality control (RQC) complex YloA/Tae2 family protein